MITGLICGVCVLTVGIAVLLWQLQQTKIKLATYSHIAEPEQYKEQCLKEAAVATAERDQVLQRTDSLRGDVASLESQVSQYQKVVRDFKSAAELQKHVRQLSAFAEGCNTLRDLQGKIEHQTHLADQLAEDAKALGFQVGAAKSAGDIQAQIRAKKNELDRLQKEILSVEEARDLQQYGFYRRHYDFDSSEVYKQKLDSVRDTQKSMIKAKTAAVCDTEWTVEGSKSKGRKMVNDQIRLLLRSFNGECDAAVAKVTYSNATSLESRIGRSFDQINRMGEVNRVNITRAYLELKLQELYLTHEYQTQKFEEKEEQKRIKQMMKEEAKVEQEIKKAKIDAEKEEAAKAAALEKAREELRALEGKHTEKLANLVAKLEDELKDAIDRKAKAIARAQLTRSGHVYILSNIGSFGENVYKIGMTRRLEPLERVKELGSASVPFFFDVHAMIYSEDAPKLENTLHRHFAHRRVNVVNMRKEFFNVTLDEIRDAVAENFGTVTFTVHPEAAEYRQTVACRNEDAQPALSVMPGDTEALQEVG